MTANEKLDLILLETQGVRAEIADMKVEIAELRSDMQVMKTEIADMKVEIVELQLGMQNMQNDIEEMNQKITGINLIIENEIRVSIQRVAEGHLDLSRNLHEAMKPNAEVEMLSVKVMKLEMDVGKLKEKIS